MLYFDGQVTETVVCLYLANPLRSQQMTIFLVCVFTPGAVKNPLFLAFQNLMRVWNHPGCTILRTLNLEQLLQKKLQKEDEKARKALKAKYHSRRQALSAKPVAPVGLRSLRLEMAQTHQYFTAQ